MRVGSQAPSQLNFELSIVKWSLVVVLVGVVVVILSIKETKRFKLL